MNAVSVAPVVHVPIMQIVIGERRREKLGRLQRLAHSIQQHGLIHPILLRGDTLVAGHRRLEACRSLKWKTIPARQVEKMTDDELRAIELDENTAREDLSTYAMGKTRLAQIRQAEADLKAKATKERSDLSTKPVDKSAPTQQRGRGRPKTDSPRKAVAEETGISPAEQVRVERHVELAEQYPFMQRPDWLRHHVFEAAELIGQLPEADRQPITALLDQPAIPRENAMTCLTHAVSLEPAARHAVIALAQHVDPFERRRALVMLARRPPLADPGLLPLAEMAQLGRKAAKLCRSVTFKTRIVDLARQAEGLYSEFNVADRKERADAEAIR